jgi:hypothetical protein
MQNLDLKINFKNDRSLKWGDCLGYKPTGKGKAKEKSGKDGEYN